MVAGKMFFSNNMAFSRCKKWKIGLMGKNAPWNTNNEHAAMDCVLAWCRNAYYACLHNTWVKFASGLIKYGVILVLTVYFAVEGNDPYAPIHIVLADMFWVSSVLIFYLDKFLCYLCPAGKA